MHHIAVLGAGSISHSKRLLNDLFNLPLMQGTRLVLMSPHIDRVTIVADFATRLVAVNRVDAVVESTDSIEHALSGAEVVFLVFDSGGFTAFDRDFQTAQKYGIDSCVGDTLGPTGIMKACRNITVLQEFSAFFVRLCPDALVVNYVNPMAPMVISAHRLGMRNALGICGGVEATRKTIGACLERPPESIDFRFAGINHMTWALEISSDGADLYPELKQRMSAPAWIAAEPVRFEVLQHFGYFVTETSGHLSDFFPWFRKNESTRALYCSGAGYTGASGAYHRYASYIHRKLENVNYLQFETGELEPASDDYGARMADAWLRGGEFQFYGNVPNSSGLVANLPRDCAVELPIRLKNRVIAPDSQDDLPLQLAALCQSNITVHKLTVEAALTGNRELLIAALSMDPLTGAVLTLPEIRSLTAELLSHNSEWLPPGWFESRGDYIDIGPHIHVRPASVPGENLLDVVRRYDREKRKATRTAARQNLS